MSSIHLAYPASQFSDTVPLTHCQGEAVTRHDWIVSYIPSLEKQNPRLLFLCVIALTW